MSRSPAALLLVLLPLVGCGDGNETTRVEAVAESEGVDWFPAAPFRDDIRLPEASQARPWQPPAEGPVPVVEVLRDGRWLLDGEPVEGDADARRAALETGLRENVIRMPKERLAPDLDSRPRIPSNPVVVRVDREAPWDALCEVIETCHGWRVQVSRVELQVRSEDPAELRALSVPMARDFGTVCVNGGAWTWSWLLLEAGSDPEGMPTTAAATSASLAFLVPDYIEDQAEDHTSTESFESVAKLAVRLEESLQNSWREISIDLPGDAPAWLAVAALDLGTQAGVELWGFPPLPEAPDRTW